MQDPMIESNPEIMMGKPVVRGTRVTVELILEKLGAGETVEQILEAHPRLTREGVLAAIRYGVKVLRTDDVYPVEGCGMNIVADESVDGPSWRNCVGTGIVSTT